MGRPKFTVKPDHKIFLHALKQNTMKEGWIDWKKSRARHIILEDLRQGIVPLTNEECSVEEAWHVWYKNLAEIIQEGVVFDQFKDRFADHRKQVASLKSQSLKEIEAFRRHQQLHPPKTHDEFGNPRYCMHAAKDLLRQDMSAGMHKRLTPNALRETRNEYKVFSQDVFWQHVYQEVRRQKFINFLEQKCRKTPRQIIHQETEVAMHVDDKRMNLEEQDAMELH